ncbi:DNA/RNA helicase [Paenibacillus pinisoli]|uniref:DNA/RNA helicase n=1 Tax=Paenibacillus pinisoli TaxID=1276110 RepID=A0A3A6P9V2_9BACL|nr:helicase-related protein [Paenibacillus pinisoli]RJX36937.1 DNA/RNA helicase [Paenibacillus pinisoli]
MMAWVYIVHTGTDWEAKMTLEPQVDYWYWFEGGGCTAWAVAGWLWSEPLPLGWACGIAEGWDYRGKGGEKRALGNEAAKKPADSQEALAHLVLRIERMYSYDRPSGDSRRGVHRLGGKRGLREADKGGLRGRAEYWPRAGHSGPSGGAAERGMEMVAASARIAAGLLQGRALLSGEARALLEGAIAPVAGAGWSEAVQLAALLGRVRLSGAVAAADGGRADARRRSRCLRCGSGGEKLGRTSCASCGRLCAYCEACLTMGRSRECELLVLGRYEAPERMGTGEEELSVRERLDKWGLSTAQHAAAGEALRFVEAQPLYSRASVLRHNARRGAWKTTAEQGVGRASWLGRADEWRRHFKSSIWNGRLARILARGSQSASERTDIRNFLLWAVTGAGKTEMIFPLVDSVISRGGRALIASPRRDVVLELDPRIRRAFPDARVVTLYGGSEQRWERGEITLSTTHQLFRFQEAFDLVVLDELDAFPYHGDPMLKYAADKSCLPGAPRLLLSATPPSELQRAARIGKLAHARVPVRYHRHPLPVPSLVSSPAVKAMLEEDKLPKALVKALRDSLNRGAQIFVFVQRIAQSEPLAALLRRKLQCAQVDATSSQDPNRAEKVMSFRKGEIRLLVTTTILERGVTIPKSDVYILDADGKLFDEASLVQMAGRAGRSADDPGGKVYFFGPERNQSQLQAVKHIRSMNKMARERGYLLPKYEGRGARA